MENTSSQPKQQKTTSNALVKFYKGIIIYFQNYILFIKNGIITAISLGKQALYSHGLHMIIVCGLVKSYKHVNSMMYELAPVLVKGGIA
jgi:hypothetical protein